MYEWYAATRTFCILLVTKQKNVQKLYYKDKPFLLIPTVYSPSSLIYSSNGFTLMKGIKSGDYEEIRDRIDTKLLSNGSLVLQNVKEDIEGFYLCQAQNGIGNGVSKVLQLKVNCKYHSLIYALCFNYVCIQTMQKISELKTCIV